MEKMSTVCGRTGVHRTPLHARPSLVRTRLALTNFVYGSTPINLILSSYRCLSGTVRWLSASIVSSVGGPFVYILRDSIMAAGHVAEAEGAGPGMGL